MGKRSALAGILFITFSSLTLAYGEQAPPKSNWVNGWKTVESFTWPRRALAAVAANGFLYVIGGMDDNSRYIKTVEYAAIRADGTLGQWEKTAALNKDRFYLAAVELNGYIYAIGGANGARGADNIPIASVERAKINSDGSLAPWKYDSDLTTPRRGLKAVVNNSQIYAIGGYNGIFLKSIDRGIIDNKGGSIQWQEDEEYTIIDRYIHSATTYIDSLYVLGGHMNSSNTVSYGDVEKTTIRSDGSLGSWHVEHSSLLTPRFLASAFTMGDYIYILGGHNGLQRLRSVEVASIGSNGHIGKWSFAHDLKYEHSTAAIATWRNTVYVLGGSGASGAQNKVEMAQAIKGKLGFMMQTSH